MVRELYKVSALNAEQEEVAALLRLEMEKVQAKLDALTPLTQGAITPVQREEIRAKIRPLRKELLPYANMLSAITRDDYNTSMYPGSLTPLAQTKLYLGVLHGTHERPKTWPTA